MSITTKRPTTQHVQHDLEVENGREFGLETRQLWERVCELERTVKDGAVITLYRDGSGTACAIIDGDARFSSLYLTDQGRVGFGGINLPEFHPTIAAFLEAEDRA